MNRKTIYGALIAGVPLSGPVLPAAVAGAEPADTDISTTAEEFDFGSDTSASEEHDFGSDTSATEEHDVDSDTSPIGEPESTGGTGGTGKAPGSGSGGANLGPNQSGWSVHVVNDSKFTIKLLADNSAFPNVESATSKVAPGGTGSVKGKMSDWYWTFEGTRRPANMDFAVASEQKADGP
jgi:hypothetical protein